MNDYPVSLQRSSPRTIAAVNARVRIGRIPMEFKRYLDQVYAARTSGIQLDGQNVFLYRSIPDQPDLLDVEFGVGVKAPFARIGNVREVDLPVGEVATATHWGSYAGLGAAHAAVTSWCRSNGRTLAGTSWEVYGHWTEDESKLRTDVYWLLAPL